MVAKSGLSLLGDLYSTINFRIQLSLSHISNRLTTFQVQKLTFISNIPAVSCHGITCFHADSKSVNWKLFPGSASCCLTYFFFKGHVTSLCCEMSHLCLHSVSLSQTQTQIQGKEFFILFFSPNQETNWCSVPSRAFETTLNYNAWV